MKKLAKISAVLAAMVLALSFAACSDSDDDDDGGAGGETPGGAATILSKAAVPGGFNGWDAEKGVLKQIDDTTYTYEFTATETEVEFGVQKVKGSWTSGRWGAGKITAPAASEANVGKASDAAALTYNNEDNNKITGLGVNCVYTLTLKIGNASNALSASVTLKEFAAAPTKYSLKELTLKGGWEGYWANTFTLTDEAVQEYTTLVGEHSASGNKFGIYGAKRNLWVGSDVPFGTRTELKYTPKDGSDATMAGDWEVGATYTIKLELTDDSLDAPKLFITVTKKN